MRQETSRPQPRDRSKCRRGAIYPETANHRAIGFGFPTRRPIGAETACAGNCADGDGPCRGGQSPGQPRAADDARDPAGAICAHPQLGKYGMTVSQVAEVYGAAVADIEQFSGEPDGDRPLDWGGALRSPKEADYHLALGGRVRVFRRTTMRRSLRHPGRPRGPLGRHPG